MTLAVPARVFSFDEFARQNHRHFPGDRLDAQFAAHQDAISGIHEFLAKAFRSDGQLLNGAITPETLSPSLVDQITRELRLSLRLDMEKAHKAAEQARIDADNARQDLENAKIHAQQALFASQQVNGSAGSAISELKALETRAQVASEVLAARQASVMSLQASVLAGTGSSEEWSVASMQWAEHMGGPLPAETIAWMGITGDHWSSRWWANQASIIVSEITDAAEDAIDAVDEFHDLYLGAFNLPPTLDNDGDALIPGAMYFNTSDNTMYVWTGTAWQGMTGDVGILSAQNLGTGLEVYSTTVANVLQFNTLRGAGLASVALASNTLTVTARPSDWTEITNKPPTFPPSTHTHVIADTTGLQAALDSKLTPATADANYVNVGGDVMTGHLGLPTNPSASQAVRRDYVDAQIVTGVAAKVAKIGDTMSGDLTIAKVTPALILDKANATENNLIWGRRATSARWAIVPGNATAEGGANTGSNFAIVSYDDLGAPLGTPFSIARASGVVSFAQTPLVAGSPLIGGATIGDLAPSSPIPGQFWWESDSGTLFLYYNDGNSQQWVDVSGNATASTDDAPKPVTFLQFPPGISFDYWGPSAPPGALFCAGQAISRTIYAALFTVLGTTYGAGDGSSTFNLPDLRGRVSAGVDNMGGTAANRITSGVSGVVGTTRGAVGGDQRMNAHNHTASQGAHGHTLSDPGHVHSIPGGPNAPGSGTAGAAGQSGASYYLAMTAAVTGITLGTAQPTVTVNSNGAGGSENLQPTIMCNKIMTTGGV